MDHPDQAASTAPGDGSNRRGGIRRATLQPAQIVLDDAPAVPCVIRDVSATGARLGVSRRHALPEAFELTVTATGLTRWVERVWRRGDFVGVRLLSAKPAPTEKDA